MRRQEYWHPWDTGSLGHCPPGQCRPAARRNDPACARGSVNVGDASDSISAPGGGPW
ncbi:MAG: hypothetical protein RL033_312 [Pseudomonadota bacterium]